MSSQVGTPPSAFWHLQFQILYTNDSVVHGARSDVKKYSKSKIHI